MKGVIELSGDFANTVITYYVSPRFINSEGMVDGKKLKSNEYIVYATDAYRIQHAKIAKSNKSHSFVWVKVDSPWSDWDIKKVKCNVPIEVTYSFSLIGWCIFSVRKILRVFK